jgi:hypothetical protein
MVSFMQKKKVAFEQMKSDLEAIEKSKHKYIFKSIPPQKDAEGNDIPQGETYYDVTNKKVVIAFPVSANAIENFGLKGHEIRHGGQFEGGKLSFNKTTGKAGVLVDLYDEIEACDIQYILDIDFLRYGKVDLKGNPATDYVVNKTTVLALGIYNALSQTEINIHTDPQGTTLQNAGTNATDIFVKP